MEQLFPILPRERTANIPCPVPPHLRQRVNSAGFPFWICLRECFCALECDGGWEGREWIKAQTAWQHLPPGEKEVRDAPQGFLGTFPNPFPFLRAPQAVICCPPRPLWAAPLISPRLFSLSARPSCLLGLLPKPPCPVIPLSLPCCCSGPKEISPGRSCRSPPGDSGVTPGGATCGGDTCGATTPSGSAALVPPPVQPSPRGGAQ